VTPLLQTPRQRGHGVDVPGAWKAKRANPGHT